MLDFINGLNSESTDEDFIKAGLLLNAELQLELNDVKFKLDLVENKINHIKDNAIIHRNHGNEHTATRDFNDLIKLAQEALDILNGE